MLISYNWLRELTETQLSAQELRERLTMAGLAIDSVEEADEDFVLDVEVPSNRGDCLSHLGIAREVSVIEGKDVCLPESGPEKTDGKSSEITSVEIINEDLCPRYAARVVRGVKIGPSPEWLVKRLEAVGQRSVNNVADITNLVMLEQGQPLHAFDLAKLAKQRIVVRRAHEGETIKTLDGTERKLDPQILVIADAARAVAIAGVMGGEDSEISAETRDVLIESAYFDPTAVRHAARMLGLHTEASNRFERGADYEGVLRAQERCVALICEIAGGTATEDAIDVYPERIEPRIINLRFERVEALTGLRVESEEMERILSALGFTMLAGSEALNIAEKIQADGEGAEMSDAELSEIASGEMAFIVPTWRADVSIEEDLVEEIARHAGYEKIGTELPASNMAGEYQPGEIRKRAMRQCLTTFGYNEAVSFSFISAAYDDRFELIPDFVSEMDGEHHFLTLDNPIIEGASRMRQTLLPGLLEAVRHNFNQRARDVKLFETGRVFAARVGDLPEEREAFALVATGGWAEEGRAGAVREIDFFDLKGALETAVDAMHLPPLKFTAATVKHLREGQAARISLDGENFIGSIGRLEESIVQSFKFRQPVYVAEIDLTTLLKQTERAILYKPLARFPSVMRDISLIAGRRVSFSEMLDAVHALSLENLRGAELVDVYQGAGVPEDKRSVTLRFEYRADERTLRDEEVEEMHARAVNSLTEKLGAEVRQ